MVYRLNRASKSLTSRIFLVVLLYSLIIGFIGILFLGTVINFDMQSFNPQVYNANLLESSNTSSAPSNSLLCNNYGSQSCNWFLFKDLYRSPYDTKYQPVLSTFYNSLVSTTNQYSSNNNVSLLLLNDKSTNQTIIASPYFHADIYFYGPNDYIQRSTNPSSFGPDSLARAYIGCGYYVSSQPSGCSTSFYYVYNGSVQYDTGMRVFTFSNGSLFIGSNVLIQGTPQSYSNQPITYSDILCYNLLDQCQYNKVDNYKYANSTTTVTAFQAVVQNFYGGNYDLKCVYDSTSPGNSCNSVNYDATEQVYYSSYGTYIAGYFYLNEVAPTSDYTGNFTGIVQPTSSCRYSSSSVSSINFACGLTQKSYEQILTDPLGQTENKFNSIVPVFKLNSNSINIKIAFLKSTTAGRSTPGLLLNILSHPQEIIQSIFGLSFPAKFVYYGMTFFIVDFIVAYAVIYFKIWGRIGSRLGTKIPFLFRGKFGSLLELTQFFDFGGHWYLEVHGVYDYNFTSTRGVIHELINERWRDTIFFPTSLAASISIVFFTWFGGSDAIFFLLLVAGFLPFLLAFWIPMLWVIEDSGLKRSEWSDRGELNTIQKISDIIRDGFNKLVGFGAVFGIGTAGATIARSQILGQNVTTTSAFTGGLVNILNLNFNFLTSAILWTISLLLITTAISLTANIMLSLNYLNSSHLKNVEKLRKSLQEKEVYLGTTQQVMDYANIGGGLYYDSKEGLRGGTIEMPPNKIIAKQNISSGEDLTKIIIQESSNVKLEDEKGGNGNESEEDLSNITNQGNLSNDDKKSDISDSLDLFKPSDNQGYSEPKESSESTVNDESTDIINSSESTESTEEPEAFENIEDKKEDTEANQDDESDASENNEESNETKEQSGE